MSVDWGNVPAWLGAGSLLVAFSVFIRDRNERERAQVDRIGIWATTEWERKAPTDQDRVENCKVNFFIRNSTDLPVDVIQVAYELHNRWMVTDHEQSYPDLPVWSFEPGTDVLKIFIERMRIPPGDTKTWSQDFNFAHLAPDSAVQPEWFRGLDCRVKWALLIDNAGRRWEVSPSRGKRSKRVRWYSRRREYQPRDWDR
ncbi:hypothetical protein SK571_37815 [Lentzea sp. BCCO 10_0798]|uniref:Uncharacterized protein n=1 Tax=Lentzea kristufekii TaxID=3095430 RepID=A0ABU4U3L2_9PSEU|nr:hypothetical protein [Lentzea sp. BCCO 10_0798]MDX8055163.1 hypothetical protein [Lentzea sp. BCCO 10_0798]